MEQPYRASALDEGSWSLLGDGGLSQDSYEGVERLDDHQRFASRQAYEDYFGVAEGSQQSLLSRSVQTGEKRFQDSQDEDSSHNELDTRKFLKESHTLMLGALSVERSLLNNFGVKTSVASRADDSHASQDLARMSVGSGFFRESQFEKATEEEILKMNAWIAFKKYGTEQGDLAMDGGSRGIPVSVLPEALQKVAKSIPMTELAALVARQQYPSKALLKWQEFNGLVHEIYHLNRNTVKQGTFGGVKTPTQATRTEPSGHSLVKQRQSRMGLSSPPQHHQPQTRHHPDASQQLMMSQAHHASVMSEISHADIVGAGAATGSGTENSQGVAMVPMMKMKPMDRLLQKQRGASSIRFSQLPNGATNDIGTSGDFVDINGRKVSRVMLNDLMCKKAKEDASVSRKHTREMQILYPLRDVKMSKAQALQRLSQPLLKNKVYAMTHQKESYAEKWRAMRKKREERMSRDHKKGHRQETIASLTRLVSDGEKSAMYRYLQERNAVEQVMAETNVEKRRKEEDMRQEIIEQRKEEARLEKSQSAANLKHAVVTSVEATRAALRDEFRERKALADEHKFQLNENSSALLTVPNKITESIAKAKTLDGWNAAKETEKLYLENTMTRRIKKFAEEKNRRLTKAAENMVRVAHTPLDRQATTPYDFEMAAKEASVSQLDLGSIMSSITQGSMGIGIPPRSVPGGNGSRVTTGGGLENSVHSADFPAVHLPPVTRAGTGTKPSSPEQYPVPYHRQGSLGDSTTTNSDGHGGMTNLQPTSYAVTPVSKYGTPLASRAQQREYEQEDEELNVMAIKEYISTRTRMEGDEQDKDGKIIRNGIPDSPVSFTDSPEQERGPVTKLLTAEGQSLDLSSEMPTAASAA